MRRLTTITLVGLVALASAASACGGDNGETTPPVDDTGSTTTETGDLDTGTAPMDTGSTPDDTGSTPDDTGTAAETSADTGVAADTGIKPDTSVADTGTAPDTTVADTGTAPDTTVADTGTAPDTAVPPTDTGADTTPPTPAGITVNPTSGLTTNEDGTKAVFTIKLNSAPTAPVTIPLSSSMVTEGTVSPSSVTFTTGNWNVEQTVTVTGVDDGLADGDRAYSIITGAATSTDTNYNGLNAADVSLTNQDKGVPDIVTVETSITTSETGTTASFQVKLRTPPTGDVTVPITILDTTEAEFSTGSPTNYTRTLTFTTANWNTLQTLTIRGKDDLIDDGNVVHNLRLGPATSADTNYNGKVRNLPVTNNDDADTAGLTVTNMTGLITDETGAVPVKFTVKLNSEPVGTVTVPVTSLDTTEGRVSTTSGGSYSGSLNLTFDSTNWNVAKDVWVKGWDDAPAWTDGNKVYDIRVGATTATGGDPRYGGAGQGPLVVTVTNNDVVVPAPPAGCTKMTYQNHDYWYCKVNRTYDAARTWCQSTANVGFRGGDLPAIANSSENFAMASHFDGNWTWIGLRRSATTPGNWTWVNGTEVTCLGGGACNSVASCDPANYTKWAPAEPNNAGCGEACAHMWSGGAEFGSWNDLPCTNSIYYWCELNGSTQTVSP